MINFKKHSNKLSFKAGLFPGTLINISENNPEKTSVNCIEFNHKTYNEHPDITPENVRFFQKTKNMDLKKKQDTNFFGNILKKKCLNYLLI